MNVDDGTSSPFVDEAQLHERDHMAATPILKKQSSQQHQADYKMKLKMSQKLKSNGDQTRTKPNSNYSISEAALTKLELRTSLSSSASQQLLIADASPPLSHLSLPAATPTKDPIAADPDHPEPEHSINREAKNDDSPRSPQQ